MKIPDHYKTIFITVALYVLVWAGIIVLINAFIIKPKELAERQAAEASAAKAQALKPIVEERQLEDGSKETLVTVGIPQNIGASNDLFVTLPTKVTVTQKTSKPTKKRKQNAPPSDAPKPR
ncbi:MAG: hypothetical protein SGI71_00100 [Verrucomicrobiota bacterium]|nr:hypothetical protein [Verrucomicrobiota bacterium]